jgi:8-oxo-dGTP pyrophosphatase MutT (NUDIX family)
MRTIHRDIVGIFLFSNDDCLLLGKSRKGGVYSDLWIVPGGGVEEGETKLEALKRETVEEVGIDISGFKTELLDEVLDGESQKVLRDTGEKVLVKMTFHDFLVKADKPSKDIEITCDDDLSEAKWHHISELKNLNIAGPTKTVIKSLGYL